MIHPCDKPCGNKSASGYCATTTCINPQYSNIGTAQYGQGVQKRIITNADRIRAMTDEELTDLFISIGDGNTPEKMVFSARDMRYERKMWLDWLKQEVKEDE